MPLLYFALGSGHTMRLNRAFSCDFEAFKNDGRPSERDAQAIVFFLK